MFPFDDGGIGQAVKGRAVLGTSEAVPWTPCYNDGQPRRTTDGPRRG